MGMMVHMELTVTLRGTVMMDGWPTPFKTKSYLKCLRAENKVWFAMLKHTYPLWLYLQIKTSLQQVKVKPISKATLLSTCTMFTIRNYCPSSLSTRREFKLLLSLTALNTSFQLESKVKIP